VIRAYLVLGIVSVSALMGAMGGYGFSDYLSIKRVNDCAYSIALGKTDSCPKPITAAFQAMAQMSGEQTVEYRDRTIQVTSTESKREIERLRREREDLIALSRQEKTNACGASPAFRLRREQLCRSYGGADCAEPEAHASPS
jgi:hypothetical protein